jgi:hypothetical protein
LVQIRAASMSLHFDSAAMDDFFIAAASRLSRRKNVEQQLTAKAT